ncbi:MAG TPA: sulfatase, partial [Thermoanaerobaculia bacterium]|nr:sulfatase [Thermoanaerobaculia bacterium]
MLAFPAMAWRTLLGLALMLVGCSPPRTVEHDLAALLPVAEVSSGVRAGRGSLFLPPGTEAVFYLDLPGESEFSLAGVSGSLAVEVQEEGKAEKVLGSIAAGTVELPGKDRHLLRLALRADGGAVRLARPRVISETRQPEPVPAPVRKEKSQGKPLPNVIIYLVDTLRADRLGCYGYPKPTSPHLDRFAEGATLFETAVAQAPWTRPSVASILTGMGPLEHGVRTLEDRLPDAADTLPERLRAAGYRTAAFSTNWHVSKDTGLAQGFDDFLFFPEEPDSTSVNRRVLAWLDGHRGSKPFFLYIHALDPHAPYLPPPDLRRRFAPGSPPQAGTIESLRRIYKARGEERSALIAEVTPLYDAEIAANDRSFGALLSALKDRELFEESLIVFVSDHGEAFGEHRDFGHARSLYAEELDVPLVVKLPSQVRGERSARLAQHVDLLPTVLAAAGLPPAPGLRGEDLFGPGESGPAFSHLSYSGRVGMSVVFDGWKRIEPWSRKLGRRPELYRGRDEHNDLVGSHPVRSGFLATLLRAEKLRSRHGLRPEQAGMDEETRRGLE